MTETSATANVDERVSAKQCAHMPKLLRSLLGVGLN